MKWNPSDQQDSRIVTFTRWRNINKYETLEERAGVYIFANIDWQVKYVGKAGAGRMVVESKNAIFRDKAYSATRVKALYTNSNEKALRLKEYLIKKYNPLNNPT